MARENESLPILDYLRKLFGASANAGVSDAELLRRFVDERDEAAFELLMGRHAATVLHVCRRVLRDEARVEDAFQATFLVFVRKAGSISQRESLGGWLYRVAYRIALKAQAQTAKHQTMEREGKAVDLPDTSTEDAEQRELRRIICEEVDRLPAQYRAAIVACFFEGKTHEEAAQQLGWPRGTVASRVAHGRDILHRRLIRRGITLTVGALGTALSTQTSMAALAGLLRTTVQTVKLFATGASAEAVVPPSIVALAEGVLQAMYWTKIKLVAIVLFVVAIGGASATFWAASPRAKESPEESTPRTGATAVPGDDKKKAGEDTDKLTRDMGQSRLNLRKLALAMHAYADKHYGHLPPPAIYGKDGKALLSWRVALLPYLDQNNLYKLFHLDEPWDSEHNKNLLEIYVPKVYASVGKPETPRWRTYYQVFTALPSDEFLNPAEITRGNLRIVSLVVPAFVRGARCIQPCFDKDSFSDGTANTILIVEAGHAVPWTKPEDLPYEGSEPLPELGGLFPDIFQAAFADGSVRILKKKYDETTLRHAITRNDGFAMNFAKIEAESNRQTETTAKQGKARIKELLKQQREQAEKVLKIRLELFTMGANEPGTTTPISLTQLVAASKCLLKTELELSENKADRLAAYERNLKHLKEAAEITKVQYKGGRISRATLAQAQYEHLGAEIELEREKERK